MSPEQIEGAAIDGKADVYSLGCMLYHCLAGTPPFERDSQVAVMYAHLQDHPPPIRRDPPGAFAGLDSVIGKAIAKRSEDRYASCAAFVEDAVRAHRAGAATPACSPLPSRASTVLVAADEPGIRATIRLSLGAGKTTVVEAARPDEALELARRERPAVVLVDWRLAGTSGAALARALRDERSLAETKIVLLATRQDAADRAALAAAGADAQITKPFSSLQLLNLVGDLIGEDELSTHEDA
jgi:serine/threonine-protein kinase